MPVERVEVALNHQLFVGVHPITLPDSSLAALLASSYV
jgi:hypothetical protein